MLSKLYIVLAFAIACLLAGCSSNVEHWDDHERIVEIVEINRNFRIMCDRSTNIAYLYYSAPIAYLYYSAPNRAGITAYLNADGNPARCNEVHR